MTLTEAHKQKRLNRVTSTTGADAIINSEHMAARRILGIDTEDTDPTPPIYLLRGHYFEESICNLAEKLMNDGTEYMDPMPVRLQKHPFRVHKELPWLGSSVDRIATIGGAPAGIVEAKSYLGAKRHDFGDPGTDQVDERTFVQCCIHMAVLELSWCRVPLDTGFDFELYHIDRDKELEQAILVKLETFFHRWIEPNIGRDPMKMDLPPVDGSDGTTDWIKNRYRSHSVEVLPPEPRHYKIAKRYEELKEELRPLEEELNTIKNRLRDEIGATASSGFRDDLLTMTWKLTKGRKYVDWDGIVRDLGIGFDVIERHTKETEGSRRLYVKLKKGGQKRVKSGKGQLLLGAQDV